MRLLKLSYLSVGLMLGCFSPGSAQTQSAISWTAKDAGSELSSEASQCAIYYSFASQCMANSDRKDTAVQLDKAATAALKISFMAGKMSGLMADAVSARLQLFEPEMMRSVQKNCANISILMIKYMDNCKALVEHPEVRLNALLKEPPASN